MTLAEPPLVGRDTQLAQAIAALSELTPSGIVFIGQPGVGTSRLALETCLAMAGRGRKTVEVAGSLDADSTPYGAVAHLLDDDAVRSGVHHDPIAMFAHLRDVLARGAAARQRPLLYVDNVESLDDASRAVIVRLTQADVIGIVTTAHIATGPETATTIDSELRLVTIQLDPLDHATVHQLAEGVLGGTVDGLAASNIFRASGGLPHAVVEFVSEAVRTGALIFERGLWHLQGALTPSVTLRRSVAQRLAPMSGAATHALTLLAVAESMPAAAMEMGIDDHVIAELETHRLIATTGRGAALTVTVASPVVAAVLQADTSALRRRQLLREAARLVDALPALHPRQATQVAVWHVEAGLPADPALLAEGAHQASAARDYVALLPLALAAHHAEPSLDMLLLAAEAMYELGYYSDAERLLVQAVDLPQSEVDRLRLANARHRVLLWGQQRAQDSIDVLVAARRLLRDPLLIDLSKSAEAYVLMSDGRPQACLDLVASTDTTNPVVESGIAFPRTVATLYMGRCGDALELAQRAVELHRSLPREQAMGHPLLNEMARGLAVVEIGDLVGGQQILVEGYEESLRDVMPQLHAWYALGIGHVAMMRGLLATAYRWFTIARQSSEQIRFLPARRIALNGLTATAAQLGHLETAAAHAAELRACHRDIGFLAPQMGLGTAWALHVGGQSDAARGVLTDCITEATVTGEYLLQVEVMWELARVGGAKIAAAFVDDLRPVLQGKFTKARLDAVVALAENDIALMQAAERQFVECGCNLWAAELASALGLELRRDAQARVSSAAFRRAKEYLAECEGARTPGLVLDVDTALLSQREREIVNLALAGAASKDIARRLELSIRTVSNHLQNAYVKLGVSGRQELADVVDGGEV